MTERDAGAAARRWLRAGHRTWRWNDGSYAGKNEYDAVETTDEGLLWFGFDGTCQGVTYRQRQPFVAFLEGGPCRPAPQRVLEELAGWVHRYLSR